MSNSSSTLSRGPDSSGRRRTPLARLLALLAVLSVVAGPAADEVRGSPSEVECIVTASGGPVVMVTVRNPGEAPIRSVVRCRLREASEVSVGAGRPPRTRVRSRAIEVAAGAEAVVDFPIPLPGRSADFLRSRFTCLVDGQRTSVVAPSVIHSAAPGAFLPAPGPPDEDLEFMNVLLARRTGLLTPLFAVLRTESDLDQLLDWAAVALPESWGGGEDATGVRTPADMHRPWPVDFENESLLAIAPGHGGTDRTLRRLVVVDISRVAADRYHCRYRADFKRLHSRGVPDLGHFEAPLLLIAVPRTEARFEFIDDGIRVRR